LWCLSFLTSLLNIKTKQNKNKEIEEKKQQEKNNNSKITNMHKYMICVENDFKYKMKKSLFLSRK
jgi:hypothetical protein